MPLGQQNNPSFVPGHLRNRPNYESLPRRLWEPAPSLVSLTREAPSPNVETLAEKLSELTRWVQDALIAISTENEKSRCRCSGFVQTNNPIESSVACKEPCRCNGYGRSELSPAPTLAGSDPQTSTLFQERPLGGDTVAPFSYISSQDMRPQGQLYQGGLGSLGPFFDDNMPPMPVRSAFESSSMSEDSSSDCTADLEQEELQTLDKKRRREQRQTISGKMKEAKRHAGV